MIETDDNRERERESQGNPYEQHDMMMMISFISIYLLIVLCISFCSYQSTNLTIIHGFLS